MPVDHLPQVPDSVREQGLRAKPEFKIMPCGTEGNPEGYDVTSVNDEAKKLIQDFNEITNGDFTEGYRRTDYITFLSEHNYSATAPEGTLQDALGKAENVLKTLNEEENIEKFRQIIADYRVNRVEFGALSTHIRRNINWEEEPDDDETFATLNTLLRDSRALNQFANIAQKEESIVSRLKALFSL